MGYSHRKYEVRIKLVATASLSYPATVCVDCNRENIRIEGYEDE